MIECDDEMKILQFNVNLGIQGNFKFVSPARFLLFLFDFFPFSICASIVFVNHSFSILGLPPSSLLGFRFLDFVPPADALFFETRWNEGESLLSILFKSTQARNTYTHSPCSNSTNAIAGLF